MFGCSECDENVVGYERAVDLVPAVETVVTAQPDVWIYGCFAARSRVVLPRTGEWGAIAISSVPRPRSEGRGGLEPPTNVVCHRSHPLKLTHYRLGAGVFRLGSHPEIPGRARSLVPIEGTRLPTDLDGGTSRDVV